MTLLRSALPNLFAVGGTALTALGAVPLLPALLGHRAMCGCGHVA